MNIQEKAQVLDNLSQIRSDFELEEETDYYIKGVSRFGKHVENLHAMAVDAYIKVANFGIPSTEDHMPDGRQEIRDRLNNNF